RAAAERNRLGEVRRLHADVPPPESDGPRAAVPARRGVYALLYAAVLSRQLPEDPEHGHPRLGEPDGSARERAALARGDRRYLAAGGMLTARSTRQPAVRSSRRD